MLLVVPVVAGGCPLFGGGHGGDVGFDRCEQDRYGCQDLDEVPPLEGCTLSSELVVTLGQGLEAFAPLAAGEPLTLIPGGGGFQAGGGSHASVALRIEGAALDRYDVLGARLGVYEAHACTEAADGTRTCQGVAWVGNRSVLLGDGPELNVVEGVVEEFGLTMIMQSEGIDALVLQAIVEDPCGRVGVAHHDY